MNITSAEFVKGAVERDGLPRDLRAHIAFIGRSNVGKSSVINSLTQRKSLCRSSSTPGRTTEANLFLINSKWYFVDLPGYGYAKQPRDMRRRIEDLISWYLTDETVPVFLTVMIVDAKVGVTALDLEMFELLKGQMDRYPVLVLANKSDKLKKQELGKQLSTIAKELPGSEVIPYAAVKNTGRGLVLDVIEKMFRARMS